MTVYTIRYPAAPTCTVADKRTAKRLARVAVALGYLPHVTVQGGTHSAPRPTWGIRLAIRHFMMGYTV
jgi:hypothetical protein